MPGYHLFQVPTLGMQSQAHALNTIGINVANVNTGGYKRTDTQFETLISKTLQHESDLGGVKPKDYQRISQQGFINSSSRDLDLAINGDGFFYVSPTLNVSTDIFYTRDGSFQMGIADGQTSSVTADDSSTITVSNGYLVDKNGYYVLGTAADPTTGLFSASGSLEPMRIDEWAFIDQSTSTTTAELALNLPSTNGIVTSHEATVLAANSGTNNDDLETYAIEVVDSNGVRQSARMNFTKSADNTWQVSATTSRASTLQTDTVMLQGTVEAGDVYTINVGGTAVNYTVLGTEGSLSGVRDAVVAAVNANATIAATLTASAGNANGEVTLTALTAATSFTTSASASNSAPNVAQVDTATIAGTVEIGDKYSVSVNGTTVTYTVTGAELSIDEIRDNLVTAVNTDPTVSAVVTAAATANTGELTLTSDSAGTAITTVMATPTTGATVDNTATVATTTANFSATNDNAANVGTATTSQTTAAQTLTFSGGGELPSTQAALTFALTFADGATASVAIDMSQMKQYGSDFTEFNYDHNGLIKASMTGTHFDKSGHIVGSFQDGTQRSIYKLALAQFQNPDGLEMLNGMIFRETPESGTATQVFADESGRADFTPYAVEISNVDIATEFTRMIMVQNAYNSNATVFKTVDEMVTVARDLKA
ncbi:MAG: flagellar hook-basal body complex protein [Rhodospirillaceae bacterium]|nr:flagellar hook-basal body complex protein [Rhodospirillaceae bacterium]